MNAAKWACRASASRPWPRTGTPTTIQVNVAFADGRVYRLREDGATWPVEGPDGRPTVLGAGPLAFTCVRPFGIWTLTFDGQAVATSSEALVAGNKDGPLVDVALRGGSDTMAVPPWIQGTMQADADRRLKTSIVGDLMGGPRYEQLFRATGSVRVGDEPAHVHRDRAAHSPPGCAQAGGFLGPLLAVGAVPQRESVRLHRLSAAPRRRAHVQRGLPAIGGDGDLIPPASSRHRG